VAVTLRLQRLGQKKRPFYRIIAAEKESKRDGRFLEIVGTYDSMKNPPIVVLKEDRVKHWISLGAQSSSIVRSLVNKQIPGLITDREAHQRSKIQEARKKRKERTKGAAKKDKTKKKARKKASVKPVKVKKKKEK